MTFQKLHCALISAACAGIIPFAAALSQAAEFGMSEFKMTEFKMDEYKVSVSLPDTGKPPVLKKFVVQNSSASSSPAKQPQNDAQKQKTPSVPSLPTTKK